MKVIANEGQGIYLRGCIGVKGKSESMLVSGEMSESGIV